MERRGLPRGPGAEGVLQMAIVPHRMQVQIVDRLQHQRPAGIVILAEIGVGPRRRHMAEGLSILLKSRILQHE